MSDSEDFNKYLFEATHYCEPVIVKGEGSFVWDTAGNKYLDLNAGQFCLCLGHNNKGFNKIVSAQLNKIYHTNTATLTPEIFEAAKLMAQINEYHVTKTMFLSTGSEANEAAIRYAKFYSKKNGVLAIDKGYHGLTLGSQGATMGGKWALPCVPSTYSVTTPDYYHSDKSISSEEFIQNCIIELQTCIEKHQDEIGVMIIEPVIGVGGMVEIPQEYLFAARKLCSEYNIVLIFDECQCGFGRSGFWFVYQKLGVVPDILVTAKAMGQGFPVSAITMKDSIAKEVENKLTHFSSHQNDPLAAVVVSYVINEILSNNLLKSNQEKGAHLLKSVEEISKKTGLLINPRGVGLMAAFDIDDTVITDYRRFSTLFSKELEKSGVLIQAIRQGRTFRVMPNYLVSISEIDFFRESCILAFDKAFNMYNK